MNGPIYRRGVGVMLLNRGGLAFIGRRRDLGLTEHVAPGHEWQMPQGGIDGPNEDPYAAAVRELGEETNVTSVELLAEAPEWYAYDLPEPVARTAWNGRFQGQRQKWFAFRLVGCDDEIDVEHPRGGHKPEFDAWRWESIWRLPELIIPFKRPVYERVIDAFAHLAA